MISGEQGSVVRIIDDPTIAERVAKRLEGVHPNATTHVRPTAQYVSRGLQEYTIKRDGLYYVIRGFKTGKTPVELHGHFQTPLKAHNTLVGYLRRKDKFGKAIWPGQ